MRITRELEFPFHVIIRFMDTLTATKKLFHAIVVIGMATSASSMVGCSSDNSPGSDAAAANDSSSSKDSAVTDSSKPPVDAGGSDGFPAWVGC